MSRRARIALLAILGLAGLGGLASVWLWPRAPSHALRVYTAPRRKAPLHIDGRLDDPGWRDAPVTPPFVLSNGEAFAPLDCTARLVWDDQALYVGFEAQDHDLFAPHRHRDDPLYTQDVVEIFLDPDGDGLNYYEVEVSPRAVIFDALFPSYRKDLKRSQTFSPRGIRAATTLDGTLDDSQPDRGWTAELKIPWAAIRHAPQSPPKPGDRWRMNLFRIDHHADGGHFTAWTPPLVGDFHALDRFGTLVFGE